MADDDSVKFGPRWDIPGIIVICLVAAIILTGSVLLLARFFG